jgi:hypothetical protein
VVALAIALALCPISCVETFASWANVWDGPAVGLFCRWPIEFFLFPCAVPIIWRLAQAFWRRARDPGEQEAAIIGAAALFVGFMVLDTPRKLLAASWSAQCEHGEGRACFAAGDLFAHGLGVDRDRPRAMELYRRGCNRGDIISCARLLEQAPGDTAACKRVQEQRRDPPWDGEFRELHRKYCERSAP